MPSSLFALKQENHPYLFCDDALIAFAVYPHHKLDLLSGEKKSYTPFEFQNVLDGHLLNDEFEQAHVIHLTYEWGYFQKNKEIFNSLNEETLLAVYLVYQSSSFISLDKVELDLSLEDLSSPTLSEYQKSFLKGMKSLLDGECYQFNLAFAYNFKINNKSKLKLTDKRLRQHFFRSEDSLSAFAHSTSLPLLDQHILSNSPECLFQLKSSAKGSHLWSMPIKGTRAWNPKKDLKEQFKALRSDRKERAELDMITDLLRHDLASIEGPPANILKRACPLRVPGLIHQYSVIDTNLSTNVRIGCLVKALFPGGSITGAPKKRVMSLLSQIEPECRGHYCGSTLLFYKEKKLASINIRTAVVNLSSSKLYYYAGGGITLLSKYRDEFREMADKVKSFKTIFTSKN